MKVAIIGGGFTGLSCALRLAQKNCAVVLFESSESLGGLASGFGSKSWRWGLERFYHHIFDNDWDIKKIAKEVGWSEVMHDPNTVARINGVVKRLDSAGSVLAFDQMSLWGRLRMGTGLAILKSIVWGKFLEKYKVTEVLPRLLGTEGYKVVWEPLLKAKFGEKIRGVNMAWFWARVAKRTKKLGYFKGGFGKLAEKIGVAIIKNGGEIRLAAEINKIKVGKNSFDIGGEMFDRVVMTVPAPLVNKLLGNELVKVPKIDYLWGQTLVLELKRPLISDYWMNILEKDWPFLVVVEHTNLINKREYGGSHLVYLGNYLADGDQRLKLSDSDLLGRFWPYLSRLNGELKKNWVKKMYRFQAPYAQPVFPVNYSKKIPKMKTAINGLYLANMSMVYPWDRGTNYAVKLGEDAARMVLGDKM